MGMINGFRRRRRLGVWLYRANGDPSPVAREIEGLRTVSRGTVAAAFEMVALREDPPPNTEETRGPVTCFRVPYGDSCAYIFCAFPTYRNKLIGLHVVESGRTGPPEDAYALAQDRYRLAVL